MYVGLTRARRHLTVTWDGKPSRFLRELGARNEVARNPVPQEQPPGYEVLSEWRSERAKADEVPAYVVFHTTTLAEIDYSGWIVHEARRRGPDCASRSWGVAEALASVARRRLQ